MRLHDVLNYQARERPDAEFAVHGDRRLTYREALLEVHRLAHALVSTGLQIGDRVAILSKNRLESLLLYFAASKVGVVPIPLNYRLAPPEWGYILQDAQAKLLIAAEEYLPAIAGLRGQLTGVEHCIAFTEHPPGGWEAYRQWITSQTTTAPARPITDDLDVYQMYTSGTTGHPIPGTEVRIVDAQDRPVRVGAIGEVVARGPQLMRGYWRQPEASAETLRGGWLHTGDAGRLDEEGYLYIEDRITDMIVSGGENVYPHRVEQVLFQHPAIADAAVIGVPDAQWGETVHAIVVVRPGVTATVKELIAFCQDQLGGFERPRSVDVVAELPRNPSGKVLKWVLREPYWTGHQRRVAGA
jgi:acyl-CoA synthetase (AMP-forming)/AMP-acid ligase II